MTQNEEDDRETREALAGQLAAQRLEDQRKLAAETVALAERRAVERERIENRLAQHDHRLDATHESLDRVAHKLESLEDSFERLEGTLKQRDAVAEALRNAFLEGAAKQVTTRTFVLGVLTVLVPIIVLFLSSAHV